MQLAVDHQSKRFGPQDESRLREELERFDRAADIISVGSIEDVLLRSNGSIGVQSLRPTCLCLYQLCRSICSGLYQTLLDLTAGGAEETRLTAISIFNQILRLHFSSKVHGQQILCDRVSNTVEAVVGTRYRFLPNLRFFDQVVDAMQRSPFETKFCEASLNGRWLLLRYFRLPSLPRSATASSFCRWWPPFGCIPAGFGRRTRRN